MEDVILGQHLLGVEDDAGAPGASVLVAHNPGNGRRVVGQVGLFRAVLAISDRKRNIKCFSKSPEPNKVFVLISYSQVTALQESLSAAKSISLGSEDLAIAALAVDVALRVTMKDRV